MSNIFVKYVLSIYYRILFPLAIHLLVRLITRNTLTFLFLFPIFRPTIRFRNYTPRDVSLGDVLTLTRAELPSETAAVTRAAEIARIDAIDVRVLYNISLPLTYTLQPNPLSPFPSSQYFNSQLLIHQQSMRSLYRKRLTGI